MSHPCIQDVVIGFFYESGKESLAQLSPNDFKTCVPEHAVAAAVTCVCILKLLLWLKSHNFF